jgi:glycosyltransferase involved in cell wall biosynthesis
MKNNSRTKKILIEGGPLFRQKSGVGQYLYRLFEALFEQDKKNQYVIYAFLFIGKKLHKPFTKVYPNVRYKMVRYLPSKVYNVFSRKIVVPPSDLLTAEKPDIAIFGNFVRSPLITGGKTITVIYDLSYIHFRQFADKKNATLLNKRVPMAVKKSNKIITISESSKKEIVDYYKVDPDKVTIIPPAVDHVVYRPLKKTEVNEVRKKYRVSHEYILFTGTLEPRKNILGILEAYSLLPTTLQKKYQLVLAGGKGWLDGSIQKKLEELTMLDIILTGYVPDEDLPALYSGALLFVYPSFYEGFGMPPLEAMACGVPVITSNNSSLPEVVGDAGIMIDADDTDALVDSMKRVLTDNELAKKMRKAGLIQAKKFSWNTSATKMKEIINSI